jgi:methionyl-tRNA formyltransferase
MKRRLRIVFLGTPDFAVASLRLLLDKDYEVVGVVTAPDKPAGRGRKISQSAVKQFAESRGLNIMQPKNLKSQDFIEELRMLEANLQIVVAFRMLPEVVWQMPEFGTFNLHASLLPNYRGAAPINWAIINGETQTGVSTFFINDKIDTGEMIMQKKVDILPDETAGELHDKLMYIGSQLVLDTVKLIEQGTVESTPQEEKGPMKPAPKLHKDNCLIEWNDTVDNIYNMVRGLNPFPAAWSHMENNGELLNVKIYKVGKLTEGHNFEYGSIISSKSEIKVAVRNGYIIIEEIKLPGKRKMDIRSLLNGYNFKKSAKML